MRLEMIVMILFINSPFSNDMYVKHITNVEVILKYIEELSIQNTRGFIPYTILLFRLNVYTICMTCRGSLVQAHFHQDKFSFNT